MNRTIVRCGMCGKTMYMGDIIQRKDPDVLECPLCHNEEPGFGIVEEVDSECISSSHY